jgi:hypothetical protein
MQKKALLLPIILAVAFGASSAGCGAGQAPSPITPAPDSPTFIYFYTDG